jgi:hypothetical protein
VAFDYRRLLIESHLKSGPGDSGGRAKTAAPCLPAEWTLFGHPPGLTAGNETGATKESLTAHEPSPKQAIDRLSHIGKMCHMPNFSVYFGSKSALLYGGAK